MATPRSTLPLVTTLSPLAHAALQVLATIEGGHRPSPPVSGLIERAIRAELDRVAPGAWRALALAHLPDGLGDDPAATMRYLVGMLRTELVPLAPPGNDVAGRP